MTAHIRRRLERKGGNQWYKARGERHVATYCGAEPTSWDFDWRSKAQAHTVETTRDEAVRDERGHVTDIRKVSETLSIEPCAECHAARSAEQGGKR